MVGCVVLIAITLSNCLPLEEGEGVAIPEITGMFRTTNNSWISNLSRFSTEQIGSLTHYNQRGAAHLTVTASIFSITRVEIAFA